jgi:hypothetical protein
MLSRKRWASWTRRELTGTSLIATTSLASSLRTIKYESKAIALVVTVTLDGTIDVTLKVGACDRVYGNSRIPIRALADRPR